MFLHCFFDRLLIIRVPGDGGSKVHSDEDNHCNYSEIQFMEEIKIWMMLMAGNNETRDFFG